jgi:hypothetical protein
MKMKLGKLCYTSGWETVVGFWGGWLGGSALIGGGKLWTLLTKSDRKVSDLLGHVGKPAFRRQLAVGAAIACLCSRLLRLLSSENAKFNQASLSHKTFVMISISLSLATGSFCASQLSHTAYRVILYSMIALTAILTSVDFLTHLTQKQMKKQIF